MQMKCYQEYMICYDMIVVAAKGRVGARAQVGHDAEDTLKHSTGLNRGRDCFVALWMGWMRYMRFTTMISML
jgi:hypothetical protein